MRGEYDGRSELLNAHEGSPPHARRILNVGLGKAEQTRLTPACAGNICCHTDYFYIIKAHPRMRGEYPRLA